MARRHCSRPSMSSTAPSSVAICSAIGTRSSSASSTPSRRRCRRERRSTPSSTTTQPTSIRRCANGWPGIPGGPSTSPQPRHPGSTPSRAFSPNSRAGASSVVCSDPSSISRSQSTASSQRQTMIIVCLCDEAVDCDLEIEDGSEHTTLEAPAREFGEKALDGVEPGCRGWGEVEGPPGMPGQPLAHLRMLVGCVVVDDGVDRLSRRHLRLDGVEEADELLVPMALHIATDDGAVEDIEGREQCRRAMTLVVVGHRPGAALLHRQAGLSAIERLDLALLIDREDHGMGGRVDIEADDVAQLAHKLRVGRKLELLHPVRLKAVRTPDAL